MVARHGAGAATNPQVMGWTIGGDFHHRAVEQQPKQPIIESRLEIDIDFELAALADQLFTFRSQQLAGTAKGEMGQFCLELVHEVSSLWSRGHIRHFKV